MAVDAKGDCDRRMAEAFLYDPRVDAALEGQRRPGVPQRQPREVVASDAPKDTPLTASGRRHRPLG